MLTHDFAYAQAFRLAAPLFLSTAVVAPGICSAEPAPADEEVVGDPDLPWLDNAWYKVDLQVRPRIEIAKIDGLERSEAYTIRTHVGLGTKPWEGFSTHVQLENVWSLDTETYNDAVQGPNGETIIADPETTELNEVWLQLQRDDLLRLFSPDAPDVDLGAKAGRQAILLDDTRFVGNVNWRQNEQTMDAVRAQTDFGIDALTVEYLYLWDIRRVFGDKGGPLTEDYTSSSHLARVHWGAETFTVTAFAYLLDFENDSPANSSNSYGTRITATTELDDAWSLRWAGSYAFQTDAAKNPVDYHAHYAWVSGDVVHAALGSAGVVYELLGSDDGKSQFVTPLATAHEFNGFADVFVTNGGPKGLQDLQLRVSAQLPWEFAGQLQYHEYWRADGGDHIGRELDTVVTRRFNDYLTGLVLFAWFDGDSDSPPDVWRLAFQVSFEY